MTIVFDNRGRHLLVPLDLDRRALLSQYMHQWQVNVFRSLCVGFSSVFSLSLFPGRFSDFALASFAPFAPVPHSSRLRHPYTPGRVLGSASEPSSSPLSGNDTLSTNDTDPDLIVLGFQELDLTTETLLYSTSPVREETWWFAITRALGGKAAMYYKV